MPILMDQSWAILVGLAGGIGATGIGGFLTRGTMHKQVRGQAVIEHEHWLATLRLEAHSTYLQEVDRALREGRRLWKRMVELKAANDANQSERDLADAANEMCGQIHAVVSAVTPNAERVKLLGPAKILPVVDSLQEALTAFDIESGTAFRAQGAPGWLVHFRGATYKIRQHQREFFELSSAVIQQAPDPRHKPQA
ncbi:hypothetical protein ACEZCY_01285 [Streptacidiphilus sp. N1-12]|uniref:Uncharacterized protein n=2 Tax=Streptacidiphilus alkalitolerans TaxID=3342712 RepID=A0ABV6W707_9ACTN